MRKYVQHFKRKKISPRMLVILVGGVLAWRGIWGLLDLYFFPDALGLSYFVNLVIGVALLMYVEAGQDEV